MVIHFCQCTRVMYTSSTRVNSSASSGASILPRTKLCGRNYYWRNETGNNRVLSLERLGKKRILWRDVDRVKPSVNFPAAIRSISRNSGDADAIRVSLHGEIREECGAIACQAARKQAFTTQYKSKKKVEEGRKKKQREEKLKRNGGYPPFFRNIKYTMHER